LARDGRFASIVIKSKGRRAKFAPDAKKRNRFKKEKITVTRFVTAVIRKNITVMFPNTGYAAGAKRINRAVLKSARN
jgi:hypothetical protein